MIRSGPGYAAAAFVLLFIFGPLIAVFLRAGGGAMPGPADWAAIRFSVTQATLSALFSVILAIPVARALSRRQFPGRSLLITLLGAPFILPVIVAVLGLLAVFGRSGVLNSVLDSMGLPVVQIYGLHGVVLAHVFFNLPLATRILLQAWQQIPAERFRLAASLNMSAGQIARRLELPMLKAALPGAFIVIFAICLSSFTVALTLGGGPKATTVELAIYQAFRFDFDLGRAAVLAVIQTVLVTIVALVALKYTRTEGFGAGLDRVVQRWDAQSPGLRGIDAAVMILTALFLLLPLAMVVIDGIAGFDRLPASVFAALRVSLILSLLSTALALGLSLPMALTALKHSWVEVIGLFGIVSSPLVLGTGLFLIIHPIADPARLAFAVTGLVNALTALPFVLRVLIPSLKASEQDFGRLATSLGLTGWARLRILLLPRARRALGFSAGLTAAFSMGDLGVITLFADPSRATLPLQMYRLMGSYRMEAAAGAGLLLLIFSLGLFWLFDRGGRRNAEL
ncbi:MAG: thiamine/thiamine pyrophosphate ABC transporter permease ThiP [Thalassovita sp.]|nr:thiamine/thiamine pyrophosphate ABC transporter permease ThiP [Thalassovita sp.]